MEDRNDAERDPALVAVERDYPPWQAWPGVMGGLIYARRPNASPPMVVRAIAPNGLRAEIERVEIERGIR
jgi:hypothetical protein